MSALCASFHTPFGRKTNSLPYEKHFPLNPLQLHIRYFLPDGQHLRFDSAGARNPVRIEIQGEQLRT
jgi:hypothetical protein